jgi:hypothetical protein
MTYLDAALLDVTEWLCRRFQALTGRTNVWLAVQLTNLSIVVYFIWAGIHFLRSGAVWRMTIGVFCGGLLYVLTQTIFKVPIETSENSAYQRVAKGLRNPRRLRDAPLRISFLTLSVVLPSLTASLVLVYPTVLADTSVHLRRLAVMSYSLIGLTTAVLYLLACDPLPPCAGRLPVWLRGIAPARVAPSEGRADRRKAAAGGTR